MRAAFLGTPMAAVPSLAALFDIADVDVVVTRPDRPRGRSHRLAASPIKVAAQQWGLELAQPETTTELQKTLSGRELDVAVVIAYGRILSPEVLATARAGFVNVHFSLLPRWRGAAPVERAILAGDSVTGVSLMLIDEGLDTGPLISVAETDIEATATGGSLTARLAHLGARVLEQALPSYVQGQLHPAPQLSTGVADAPKVSTGEARLEPAMTPAELDRAVRAFHPRPGAWLLVEGERLEVIEARVTEELEVSAGTISVVEGRPYLGLSGGAVELVSLHPAGATSMSGRDWANGRRGQGAVVDA